MNEEKETTTNLDIFKLSETDLYDDDSPENEEEELERPRRKLNKGKVLIAVACVSLCLAICGLGFGINRNTAVKKVEKELTAAKQEVVNKDAVINELNTKIAEKDAQLNQLQDSENKTEQPKNTEEKPKQQEGKLAYGSDGSIYTVISETGMNIRESADASSEVVASLASGDDFEQEGEVIKNADGSVWVKFKWDDGYGCIQAADGTWLAKLS